MGFEGGDSCEVEMLKGRCEQMSMRATFSWLIALADRERQLFLVNHACENGYSSKFGCQCLCFFRMKSPSLGVGRSNPYPNYASSFVFQQDQDIQLY